MPPEGLQARKCAQRDGRPPTPGQEVGKNVGDAEEDDEVAERHDLIGERQWDRVAQQCKRGVGITQLVGAGQGHAFDVGGVDHARLDECLRPNGRCSVQHDRYEVGDDAEAHHRHTSEPDVAEGEDKGHHEVPECNPAWSGEVEMLDGDAADDRDHDERYRGETHTRESGNTSTARDTNDSADDDG
ncbi:MAG: hypothetical protein CL433_09120 [Acidimicrobiaceae bacterium]|nr:hypothetical protein [Acidimicrobiaceae bacterium]HAB57410.1 hypothetical protein [Acidimicrobiaceae bacterium]